MIKLHFSFIIPVFNRPQEVKELLVSLVDVQGDFEVIIVEDGSDQTSEKIIEEFSQKLDISYYYKKNTGPGDSRNYGMQRAKGNYFIILDSDVLLPCTYLKDVHKSLEKNFLDVYGGPDKAHATFSDTQKSIDYAMTSLLTTGGLRGRKDTKVSKNYEPRSFNMGISKAAFLVSGGFGSIHPGEDPDLSIRLRAKQFKIGFIEKAFVYHKRRVNFSKYSTQMLKFGMVRSILLFRYPYTHKLTYWFPTLYALGLLLGLLGLIFKSYLITYLFMVYHILVFLDSTLSSRSLKIGIMSIVAVNIQFLSYGYGFLESYLKIHIFKQKPEQAYPDLFFNT